MHDKMQNTKVKVRRKERIAIIVRRVIWDKRARLRIRQLDQRKTLHVLDTEKKGIFPILS